MSLDRTKPPRLQPLEEVKIPQAHKETLDNGISFYLLDIGAMPVTRLEFIIAAGSWQAPHPLIAELTIKMLQEGTQSYSSKEIADLLDFYGIELNLQHTDDCVRLCIECLNKHIQQALPLIHSMLSEATFPKKELQRLIQNNKQKLRRQQEETDYVARHKGYEAIFGAEHPYGYYDQPADYDNITSSDLQSFYDSFYKPDNTVIIGAGKIPKQFSDQLNHHLQSWSSNNASIPSPTHEPQPHQEMQQFYPIKNSVQSTLRFSMPTITKSHDDYPKLNILVTLLGGYFSSRLMSNIREEKGYTYGISAFLNPFVHAGSFHIATSTGKEYVSAVKNEVYRELERIQTEPIPPKELELVRQYIQGNLLTSLDSPAAIAKLYRGLILYGLSSSYIDRVLQTLHDITPEELQQTAQQYLKPEKLYEIEVGSRSNN